MTITPKQARQWALVVVGAVVVAVGAFTRDATLLALGSGLLGVPALMGGTDAPEQPPMVGEPDHTDLAEDEDDF